MKISKDVLLGNINCEWPNKISIGEKCTIQDRTDFRISHPYDSENIITIGDNVFIGRCAEFNCQSKITVANNCWIASNTIIVDIYHEIKVGIPIRLQPILSSDIMIEEDVWVGAGCIILPGVTIGRGSILGAGSVLNKSVPPNQIWAGVPAKFIKPRE